MGHQKPILVCGLPRSGTTWTSNVLTRSPGTFYIHEPDNEQHYVKALLLKQNLHRFPYLRREQNAPLYNSLWKDVFEHRSYARIFPEKVEVNLPDLERVIRRKCGEVQPSCFECSDESGKHQIMDKDVDFPPPPENRRLVIKSVHNVLALEWLHDHFGFIPVVVIRHPANIISSYLSLNLPDACRNLFNQSELVGDYFQQLSANLSPGTDLVKRMTAQIGAAYFVLEKQAENHPDWMIIRHEDLCANPVDAFHRLYRKLNLTWNKSMSRYIAAVNRPGRGFQPARVAHLEINKYQRLLSTQQIEKIRQVYKVFENPFYAEF